MKKVSVEQVQYKIPHTVNRFASVYKKPIFYLAIIGVFAIVVALALAYNIKYFNAVNNPMIYINVRLSEEPGGREVHSVYFGDTRTFLTDYDIYYTRYDAVFISSEDSDIDEPFNGFFTNTVLEDAYSAGSCDGMEVAVYAVDAMFNKITARVTFDQLGIEPTDIVDFETVKRICLEAIG